MKRKRILAFSLVLVLLFTRAGGLNPPVSVYGAGFGTTVAEYIVTLLASVNMAITEPVTLNNINASFGNLALNTVTQAELQTAVNSFNTAMGSSTLIDSFATTALEAQQYINVTGTEFLNGYQIAATSGADNLLASISNYNATGVMAPVAGGANFLKGAGPIIGAVGAGVGLGFLIDHLRTNYQNAIGRNYALGKKQIVDKPAVYKWDTTNPSYSPYFLTSRDNQSWNDNIVIGYWYDEDTTLSGYAIYINNTNHNITTGTFNTTNGKPFYNGGGKTITPGQYDTYRCLRLGDVGMWGGINFGSLENALRYVGYNGNPYYSNNFIGEEGNQRTETPSSLPTMITNNYDTENQTYKPVNWNDYVNWANQANENTQNIQENIANNPEQPIQDIYDNAFSEQGEDFVNFTNPYIEDIYQTVAPDPDYEPQPIYPDQPTIPEKPEVTAEEKEVALIGYADNIQNVFPFCIPYDLRDMVKGLIAEREAPRIQWTFQSNLFGFEYTFDIDLSEWDEVASILRLMELIAFVIGLAMVTRYIIGA